MTGPEDSHSDTRPISVAELLAKNGTIGAPPIGGRRRRRRGDTDSITVAELTGEIPIVRDQDADEPVRTAGPDEPVEAAEPSNGAVEHVDDTEADAEAATETAEAEVEAGAVPADEEADYAAHIEEREARDAEEDLDFFAPPRRSSYAPRRFDGGAGDATVGAEQMSPDPLDWARDEEEDPAAVAVADADADAKERDDLPSYLRPSDGALFGGQTVADDMARRGTTPGPEDLRDLRDFDDDAELEPASPMSAFLRSVWVVGQCVLAVAFGAGLFVAFDQLWNWNTIVALVLGVLVILGLVVGVRVVRKTEDIASTLIAVAVGALVTFGPLALLKA